MGIVISIDRTSVGGGAVVITGTRPAAGVLGLWIPAGGYTRPKFAPRRTYAPDSAYLPGRQPIGATLDEGTWTLQINVQGSTTAELAATRALLQSAFGQWRYPVTVTLDGVQETWMCGYAWPVWPESEHWERLGNRDQATVTIPVRVP